MKRCVIIFVVALAALGCASPKRVSTDGSPPVAQIGPDTISVRGFERAIVQRFGRPWALRGLVRQRLFELEAQSRGLVVDDEEVTRAVDGRLSSNPQAVISEMERRGLDRASLRIELEEEIGNELLVSSVVRAQREIEERDVQDYWKQTYAEPRVAIRHIAFPFERSAQGPDPDSIDASRRAAEKARADVLAGTPFERVAIERSELRSTAVQGGFMGRFTRAQLPTPELAETLFAEPVGTVLPVWEESGYGFHVFRIDERIEAQSLDASRSRIERELRNLPPTQTEIDQVEADLRRRYPVTIFEENLEEAGRR